MTSGVQAAKDKWLEPRESEGTPFGITHICAFYFPSFFFYSERKLSLYVNKNHHRIHCTTEHTAALFLFGKKWREFI